MILRVILAAAALLLGLSAVPAMAQDKGLRCMEASYTPAERAQLAQLGPQARFADASGANAAASALGDIAMQAVQRCVAENAWSEDLALYASFYELGRVSEEAFRVSGELTGAELARLDAALAEGDRTALWAAVERGVWAGVADINEPPSDSDAMVLGTFMLSSGVGMREESAINVGVLLGFMGLQRVGEREFRALR